MNELIVPDEIWMIWLRNEGGKSIFICSSDSEDAKEWFATKEEAERTLEYYIESDAIREDEGDRPTVVRIK